MPTPRLQLTRFRRGLSRSPALYWSSAIGVAAVSFLVARRAGAPTPPAPSRSALVVTARIARGDTVHARDVRPAIVPAALVAPGTLTSTAAAAGRVALTDMEPGDIVRTSRLGPIGVRGGAAMVRSGQRVVGIAVTDATPAMRSGDLVDVLATYPPAEEQPIRTLLVATATVVDVGPRRVSVAVPTAETRRVVEATVSAQVTLVVRPPG